MKGLLLSLTFVSCFYFSQNVTQKLEAVTVRLMNSTPAASASISFYVADDSGNLIYERNGRQGLTTASTQKIFTAAAALESLGKEYRYTTTASHTGKISGPTLNGDLVLRSNGDPTLGSWRYDGYKPEDFRKKLIQALREKGITTIDGNIIIDDGYFDMQTVPGGWPWNDIGNYYGAGVWGVSWRENQFDLQMSNGTIKNINIPLPGVLWANDLQTRGSSDASLIFTAPYSSVAYVNGNLPAKTMTISGATPDPPLTLGTELSNWLKAENIQVTGTVSTAALRRLNGDKPFTAPDSNIFFKYNSPPLSQIIYWFLRKSVNLYGETLVKTMAAEKTKQATFDSGISYLKTFWQNKGIAPAMINFADGSGLSPQNYVSAQAEVQALLYSQKQAWFPEFHDSFPVQNNGMKMKSGTMKNTKSFAGYHTSKDGKRYVFAIIINNYQASNSSDALFQVLNVLK